MVIELTEKELILVIAAMLNLPNTEKNRAAQAEVDAIVTKLFKAKILAGEGGE
jgi:hypothetical protein